MSPNPLQISQLGNSEKLVSDDSDLIPIQETNGITRRISKTNLLKPSITKTVAENNDYFIGIDADGMLFKITKKDLLIGLTSSGDSSGDSSYGIKFSEVVFLSHCDSVGDVTGKSITLVGTAAITTANPKFTSDSSFSFTNGFGYAQIQSSIDFDFSTGKNFTIEMFARWNAFLPYRVLIARAAYASEQTFNIDVSSVNIRLTGWNNVYIDVPHGMSANTWYYIAITRDGSTIKLYVNNLLKGSYVGASSFPNVNNLNIGGDPIFGSSYGMDGQVSEIRISRVAKTITTVPTSEFPNS